MTGKGDKRRPSSVDKSAFGTNWDKTFKPRPKPVSLFAIFAEPRVRWCPWCEDLEGDMRCRGCAEILATIDAIEHVTAEVRNLTAAAQEVIDSKDINTGSSGQVFVDHGSLMALHSLLNAASGRRCQTCDGSGCPFPDQRDMCGVHHCPDCDSGADDSRRTPLVITANHANHGENVARCC